MGRATLGYPVQNYESLAAQIDGTTLAMEGLALTGAAVDKEAGLLSTIVLEMGGSSDLCALLKPRECAADQVVWCCDEPPGFAPGRQQDRAFVGNVVEAIEAYGSGALGSAEIPLEAVDRIIAIGSDGMMNAVAEARRRV